MITCWNDLSANFFLCARSDVDRLYVDRNNGGRGLISVDDTVNYNKARSLKRYTETSDIDLIGAGGQLVKCDIDARMQVEQNKRWK